MENIESDFSNDKFFERTTKYDHEGRIILEVYEYFPSDSEATVYDRDGNLVFVVPRECPSNDPAEDGADEPYFYHPDLDKLDDKASDES